MTKDWYDEHELHKQVMQHFRDAQRKGGRYDSGDRAGQIYLGDGAWQKPATKTEEE